MTRWTANTATKPIKNVNGIFLNEFNALRHPATAEAKMGRSVFPANTFSLAAHRPQYRNTPVLYYSHDTPGWRFKGPDASNIRSKPASSASVDGFFGDPSGTSSVDT